jgi:hypothetical protein
MGSRSVASIIMCGVESVGATVSRQSLGGKTNAIHPLEGISIKNSSSPVNSLSNSKQMKGGASQSKKARTCFICHKAVRFPMLNFNVTALPFPDVPI